MNVSFTCLPHILRHRIRRARRAFYLRRRRGCCLGPLLILLVPLIAVAALRIL